MDEIAKKLAESIIGKGYHNYHNLSTSELFDKAIADERRYLYNCSDLPINYTYSAICKRILHRVRQLTGEYDKCGNCICYRPSQLVDVGQCARFNETVQLDTHCLRYDEWVCNCSLKETCTFHKEYMGELRE